MPDKSNTKPLAKVIDDMKSVAVQRCADRIEAAKNKCKDIINHEETSGFTSRLKRNRGL